MPVHRHMNYEPPLV